jgi:hypothetical protein
VIHVDELESIPGRARRCADSYWPGARPQTRQFAVQA